jgi:hypothetical protein
MKKLIVILFMLIPGLISAQTISPEVIASSGNYFSNSAGSLSWSFGEPIIKTFDKSEAALTQGFHQAGFNSVQNLYIMKGWSGISTYLIPGNRNPEVMFHPVMIDLVILQNYQGVLWPVQNINTLGNWDFQNGYIVKFCADVGMRIYGYDPAQNWVALDAGWSLMPVLSKTVVPVSALDSLNENFVLAKEVAGWGVYWPEYGINSIGMLLSGKAYYVMMSEAGEVEFTGMKSSSTTLTGTDKTLTEFQTLSGLEIIQTPSTHTIAILPQALKCFEQGTIIGAYDQAGKCFGATFYNNETVSLTVFGDDPVTAEKDGFYEGELILFQTLTKHTRLTPTFDTRLPNADGLFTKNGLSAITGFTEAAGTAEYNFGLHVNIFPNPTSGKINISGLSNGAEISVRDIHGRIVETGKAQLYRQSLDLSGLQPGVYFVEIEAQSKSIIKKLIVH